jgi:hypothetical protein
MLDVLAGSGFVSDLPASSSSTRTAVAPVFASESRRKKNRVSDQWLTSAKRSQPEGIEIYT